MANPVLSIVAAAVLDIKVYGGDTMPLLLEFFEDDGSSNNLSGAVMRMQIKASGTPLGQAKITWSSLDGTITIGGVDSNEVSFSNIINLKGGIYAYDLQVTYPDGTVTTLLYGNLIVQQDITDSSNEK
jgi:hypothetical protein